MNSKKANTFLVLLIVAMSTWATPALTAEIPQAKPDKGLVIFYRLSSFKGSAIRFNLNHSEGLIGQARIFAPTSQADLAVRCS